MNGLGLTQQAPVSRMSQTEEEFCQLATTVEDLDRCTHFLIERIQSIIRVDMPDAAPAKTIEEPPLLIPLADRIRSFRYRIENINSLLSLVTDRIEL